VLFGGVLVEMLVCVVLKGFLGDGLGMGWGKGCESGGAREL